MTNIPFSKDELEVKGYYANLGGRQGGGTPILNTPITPRENYQMFLRGEKPLWMPGGADVLSFTPACVPDNIARGFAFETKPNDEKGGKDMFGIEWVYVEQVGGSMVRPGAPTLEDITKWREVLKFPDVDSWDWKGAGERNAEIIEKERNSRMIGATILNGLFERMISFMDFENATYALIDEPEEVEAMLSEVVKVYLRMIELLKEYFKIDILTFHDDWGSQRAPFFSLSTVSELIVPQLKKVVDKAHSLGITFEMHSCGKNELLVPAYIEAGVDLWNGQPMNDKRMLCEKYSDQIKLGVSPLDIYPDATPEQYVDIVKKFVDEFGKYPIYSGFGMRVEGGYEMMYEATRRAYCG